MTEQIHYGILNIFAPWSGMSHNERSQIGYRVRVAYYVLREHKEEPLFWKRKTPFDEYYELLLENNIFEHMKRTYEAAENVKERSSHHMLR